MVVGTVAFGVLVTVSLIISLFVLFAHALVPKMIRPPGDFIIIQAIAQVFIDIHWYSVFFNNELPQNSPQCITIGALTVFFTSLSMNCIFALCIDITIKLRNRATSTPTSRRIIYYIGIFGFPLFLVILSIFNDDYGYSTSGSCSLKPFSTSSNIRLCSFFAEILIQLILICYINKKIGNIYSKVTFNYFLVVISESLFVFTSNLFKMIALGIDDAQTQEAFVYIYEIISSSTGIAIGICRLYNKRLLRHLLWKLRCKKKKEFLNLASSDASNSLILNENVYNLGDLYDRITIISMMQMIILISLKLSQAPHNLIDLEREKEFDEYVFDQKLFDTLVDKYNEQGIKELYAPDLHLKEYFPKEFAQIREILGIKDKELIDSFSIRENFNKLYSIQKAEGGRSSATLFFTSDSKFVLKTITNNERRFFLKKMLRKYIIHNRSISFLARIVAVFRIEPAQINYIVMENTIIDKQQALVFDLKGSDVNRYVGGDHDYSSCIGGYVLKDLNLKESLLKITVSEDLKSSILLTLERDLQFLSQADVTDYSILLAFFQPQYNKQSRYNIKENSKVYSLSIIDYLQEFNVAKFSERFLKKMVYKNKEVSVEAPQAYSSRLFNFIKTIISLE